METTKTIQSVSKEIYDNMVYSKRDNGNDYCHLKDDIQWQRDIIFQAHLERMPDDDIYDRINTILSVISNLDDDSNDDDIRDAIYEIEADCYTSDLTEWLNKDNRNVYYIEEATTEFGATDGFQILGIAQQRYIQEIGNDLINAIQEYIDNE